MRQALLAGAAAGVLFLLAGCDAASVSAERAAAQHERGRAIYNFRCYFCHGYSGDAKTLAATYLNPKPRDFTAAPLTQAQITAAVRDGDAVILSGSVGDHAVAILAARGEFDFRADVRSDCAPLWDLVDAAVIAARESGGEVAIRFLRDPTRGGLTTVLAELAEESGLGIEVEEEDIPVSPAVRSVCDLLGYDPLTLANEGKMVLVTAAEAADAVVAAVRDTEHGRDARRVGFVTAAHPGRVALRTPFGTRRVLDMPIGELLPRIC